MTTDTWTFRMWLFLALFSRIIIKLNSQSLGIYQNTKSIYVHRYSKATAKKYPNQTYDKLMGPSIDSYTCKLLNKHSILDNDGIVYAGAKVLPRQVQSDNMRSKFVNRTK